MIMDNKIHNILYDNYTFRDSYWLLVLNSVNVLAYSNEIMRQVGLPIMFIDDVVCDVVYDLLWKVAKE